MEITSSVEISGKPEDVFQWVVDPDKARLWQKDVRDVEIIEETEEKMGLLLRKLSGKMGES
jgi:uncharacterized protein YndB with AHSA1/START domain